MALQPLHLGATMECWGGGHSTAQEDGITTPPSYAKVPKHPVLLPHGSSPLPLAGAHPPVPAAPRCR